MVRENMNRIKNFFYLVNFFYFLSMNFFYLVFDLGRRRERMVGECCERI